MKGITFIAINVSEIAKDKLRKLEEIRNQKLKKIKEQGSIPIQINK